MKYHVCEFLDDRAEDGKLTQSVVPDNWVSNNICKWPPAHIIVDKLYLGKKKAPGNDWSRYRIRILASGDYIMYYHSDFFLNILNCVKILLTLIGCPSDAVA